MNVCIFVKVAKLDELKLPVWSGSCKLADVTAQVSGEPNRARGTENRFGSLYKYVWINFCKAAGDEFMLFAKARVETASEN